MNDTDKIEQILAKSKVTLRYIQGYNIKTGDIEDCFYQIKKNNKETNFQSCNKHTGESYTCNFLQVRFTSAADLLLKYYPTFYTDLEENINVDNILSETILLFDDTNQQKYILKVSQEGLNAFLSYMIATESLIKTNDAKLDRESNNAVLAQTDTFNLETSLIAEGLTRNNVTYLWIGAYNIEPLDDGTINILNLNGVDNGYSDHIFDLLDIENTTLIPVSDESKISSGTKDYIRVKDNYGNDLIYFVESVDNLTEFLTYLDSVLKSDNMESVQSFPHIPTEEELNAGTIFN